MCGIAGFWQKRRTDEHPAETLNRMALALRHRGPDDSGIFLEVSSGLGFAFRRLAILDLSAAGHQPMHSASGRLVMVFNGEVYNHEEIRQRLGMRHWRGHSDTEVMLEAIEEWGLDAALNEFVGMFAFALWDKRERRLSLCRDRLGIKPLYYGWAGTAFVFASELKAIAQYPEFDAHVNRDALAMYLSYSAVPAPYCIYDGLHKLEPGSILTLSSADSRPELRQYWSATDVAVRGLRAPSRLDEAEAVQQLQAKLTSAVALQMVADVPVGAFLSGGIDSSAVVAIMQSQSGRRVNTFTISLEEEDHNEAPFASEVAKHLGTNHTELRVTPQDALDVAPSIAATYDEPFGDSSQIPTFLVSKLARQSVTVSLSGDGGDELFGGYNRHIFASRVWKAMNLLPLALRDSASRFARTVPYSKLERTMRFVHPVLPKRLRVAVPADKAQKLMDVWSTCSSESLYHAILSSSSNPSELVLGSEKPATPIDSVRTFSKSLGFEENMMLADLLHYLPDDILTKLDRASMAVSLEARVPLLDHRVVEFAWQLPTSLKLRNGKGKWILREILAKFLPHHLMDRPKMGFAIPLRTWLQGPLRDWAQSLLGPQQLAQGGFLDAQLVQEIWNAHLSGARNHSRILWNILIFQDWLNRTGLGSQTIRLQALCRRSPENDMRQSPAPGSVPTG